MKKRFIALMLCTVMLMSVTACGGNTSSNTASETKTQEVASEQSSASEAVPEEGGAQEELSGKVVIYTSMYEDIIEAMDKKLEEVFPNVDIEFFQGGTGTLQSKIAAEKDAGKLGCDMLMVAEPAYALELKGENMLHTYVFSEADKLMYEYDKEGYWYPVRVCNMVLAYNPELFNKEELPVSFEEFASSAELDGMISMSNPLTSGTAYASIVALLDKYGEDYFKQLSDRKVAIESGSVALTKLETGECKEIMILEESVLKKREEEDSALEVIYPTDGTISLPSPIMIVEESLSANQNIAACEAIEEWFLSLEGQKYIVSGWMHSTRSDYPNAPYDAIPTAEIAASAIPVDWQKCFEEREQIRTLFQENVTVPQ